MHYAKQEKRRGIGFAFNGGIIGVDLDNVFIDGQLIPEAQDIVDTLDSFTEQSMSGNGLHVYVYAPAVTLGITKASFPFPSYPKQDKRHVEFYESAGYFAMTGKPYGEMRPMPDRGEQLQAVFAKYGNKPEATTPQEETAAIPTATTPREEKIVAPAAASAPTHPPPKATAPSEKSDRCYLKIGLDKDPTLASLWNGHRPTGDESADDQAFMNKLAYWTNCNEELMSKAFLNSPYYSMKDATHKKKVLERKDYLPRTIKTAISSTTTTAKDSDEAYKGEQVRKQRPASQGDASVAPVAPVAGVALEAPVAPWALETMSAIELWSADLPPLREIVKGLLPQGLAMVCAPSKYGKSWFALDVGFSVSAGEPFLGFSTEKTGVLYLALEDGYRRLKARMLLIRKDKTPPENFDMAIKANAIGGGLSEQLNNYLKEKPNTGLIIVDVLQRVRSTHPPAASAYAQDYADMGALKAIADTHQICVLVIHHLRKMTDKGDPYNMISGTNGIMGAADTIMLINKKTRDAKEATLHVIGRDVEAADMVIEFDGTFTYKWRLVGMLAEQQAREARTAYDNDAVVKTIKGLLAKNPDGLQITASEFLLEMPNFSTGTASPTSIGIAFKNVSQQLYQYDKIIYTPGDTKTRKHSFRQGATGASPATSATGATSATDTQMELGDTENPHKAPEE